MFIPWAGAIRCNSRVGQFNQHPGRRGFRRSLFTLKDQRRIGTAWSQGLNQPGQNQAPLGILVKIEILEQQFRIAAGNWFR